MRAVLGGMGGSMLKKFTRNKDKGFDAFNPPGGRPDLKNNPASQQHSSLTDPGNTGAMFEGGRIIYDSNKNAKNNSASSSNPLASRRPTKPEQTSNQSSQQSSSQKGFESQPSSNSLFEDESGSFRISRSSSISSSSEGLANKSNENSASNSGTYAFKSNSKDLFEMTFAGNKISFKFNNSIDSVASEFGRNVDRILILNGYAYSVNQERTIFTFPLRENSAQGSDPINLFGHNIDVNNDTKFNLMTLCAIKACGYDYKKAIDIVNVPTMPDGDSEPTISTHFEKFENFEQHASYLAAYSNLHSMLNDDGASLLEKLDEKISLDDGKNYDQEVTNLKNHVNSIDGFDYTNLNQLLTAIGVTPVEKEQQAVIQLIAPHIHDQDQAGDDIAYLDSMPNAMTPDEFDAQFGLGNLSNLNHQYSAVHASFLPNSTPKPAGFKTSAQSAHASTHSAVQKLNEVQTHIEQHVKEYYKDHTVEHSGNVSIISKIDNFSEEKIEQSRITHSTNNMSLTCAGSIDAPAAQTQAQIFVSALIANAGENKITLNFNGDVPNIEAIASKIIKELKNQNKDFDVIIQGGSQELCGKIMALKESKPDDEVSIHTTVKKLGN